ncbi:ATP synthase F0 subunit C [Candidatus Marinamargulisbacteria bacterium SCGC AG-439-L15]|nr:ATP synthase F0 subunit C [Candidatus Marinamargulisbacteria bacterium SCGC AG-439-L15]
MEFIMVCSILGAGLAIGLGAIGSAIGEGYVAMRAVHALGEQPGAGNKILRTMIIAQAITETAAIFALVVSLVLLFGNKTGMTDIKAYTFIAAGIAIGFGTIGSGFGAGLPGGSTMDGIGRNPENSDVLTIQMIIGQAVTQTSTIFALTVSLILITSSPENTFSKIFAVLGAACAMGFGAVGPGIGDGIVAKNANKAVGNSPKHMGLLTRTMIIGQAVTETTDIYALVVALILIFVA